MATAPQEGEDHSGQVPEKWDGAHGETTATLVKHWRVGDSLKSTGLRTGRPSQPTEAKKAPANPEERARKTREPQGEWTPENHPLG